MPRRAMLGDYVRAHRLCQVLGGHSAQCRRQERHRRAHPEAFWLAWDLGAAVNTDTFAPAWDFWTVVAEPLADLGRRYAIPPLDPAADATLALLRS
jgi:hypothetical protein